MVVATIPDLRSWADAVIASPTARPFPSRVVLVPGEPHAHALRRELVHRAPDALIGTRFLTAPAAARAVLDAAGVPYRVNEEERRRLRMRKLFRTGGAPRTGMAGTLVGAGWDDAFAATLGQLEVAGLDPDALDAVDDRRTTELAAIWRALDEDAGTSWTTCRILREAAAVLEASAAAWPYPGPVLAPVHAGIDAAHARFVRAIPEVTRAVIPCRSSPERVGARIRELFGDRVARRMVAPTAETTITTTSELRLLSQLLFAPPERLAADDRPRSRGPDGSVTLELHAGVDEELDAVTRWVAEEVFVRGTRLADIAVLVPRPEPYAGLIADRIEALPWPAGARPVHVACGRRASSTAAGSRLLSVIRAACGFLPAEGVCELLPRLRLRDAPGHLSWRDARRVIERLAIVGGSATRPRDALRWRERLPRLDADERLGAVAPALGALVGVVDDVLADAPLGQLWRTLRTFAQEHLILPGDPAVVLEPLALDVLALAADPVTEGICGLDALELVRERLESLRLVDGRYGDPAIYVGTIEGAAGLRFAAVRVLELAESVFPGTLREDPLLPQELRARLPAATAMRDEDYALVRRSALEQVIRNVTDRLVLSVARCDIDGTEREPASLFVEVAAALGRPDSSTGQPGRLVPTLGELERDGFAPARAAARARRAETPLTAACWLDEMARGAPVPSSSYRSVVVDPREVRARAATMSGGLGAAPLTARVPGLADATPLSASALRQLLLCPQRFLLERVLRFRARAEPSASHRIAPLAYGDLVHRILEAFAMEHGAAFGARDGDLESWLERIDAFARAAFDRFLDSYPLVGEGVIAAERQRLLRDVRRFIEDDWCQGRPRTFVAVERVFGDHGGVRVETSSGPVRLTGRIDRIDVVEGRTLVRDLKTGRAQPREREHREPSVDLDVQLAIYVVVASQLASTWGSPGEVVAAYAYLDPRAPVRERSFVEDAHVLRSAGQRWLELAVALLRDGVYVRTTRRATCRYCPFRPVCEHSPETDPADAGPTLRAFRELDA